MHIELPDDIGPTFVCFVSKLENREEPFIFFDTIVEKLLHGKKERKLQEFIDEIEAELVSMLE